MTSKEPYQDSDDRDVRGSIARPQKRKIGGKGGEKREGGEEKRGEKGGLNRYQALCSITLS